MGDGRDVFAMSTECECECMGVVSSTDDVLEMSEMRGVGGWVKYVCVCLGVGCRGSG